MSARVSERSSTSFKSWQSRRRLSQGRDETGVLESVRIAAALGQRELAVGLVVELLEQEVVAGHTYVRGDVMRRVLGSLLISIDAASRESLPLIERVMPGAIERLAPEAPLRTLALQELEVIDHAAKLESAALRIIAGQPYDSVRDAVARWATSAGAFAREREIDWLIPQLELRFEPGEDGLGRIWSAAGARLARPPVARALLSRDATARAVMGLAAARDGYEIASALANAIGPARELSDVRHRTPTQ